MTSLPPSSQLSSSIRVALMSNNPKFAEISTGHSIPLQSESTTLTSSKELSRTSATSVLSQSPVVLSPTANTCSKSIFPSCRSRTSLSKISTRPWNPRIWKNTSSSLEVSFPAKFRWMRSTTPVDTDSFASQTLNTQEKLSKPPQAIKTSLVSSSTLRAALIR